MTFFWCWFWKFWKVFVDQMVVHLFLFGPFCTLTAPKFNKAQFDSIRWRLHWWLLSARAAMAVPAGPHWASVWIIRVGGGGGGLTWLYGHQNQAALLWCLDQVPVLKQCQSVRGADITSAGYHYVYFYVIFPADRSTAILLLGSTVTST